MAQQVVNVGSEFNDPNADQIRPAFGEKVNPNFTELYNFMANSGKVNERIIPFISTPGNTEIAQVVASINASNPITVPNGTLQVFSFIQQTGLDVDTPDPQLIQFQKVRYVLKRGAGTYGSGGTAVTSVDVMFLGVEVIVGTNVFELGDIGSTPIHTFVNGSGPYVINGLTIFTATISSVDKLFIFSGANGTYGDGAIQTTASNFIDFASAPVLPVPVLNFKKARIEQGATYTLLFGDLNRTVVFENAVTITIPNIVASPSVVSDVRQQAWFSFKDDWTINYPTTDGIDTLSGGSGALVYVERRELDNEWIVKRVDAGGALQNLQQVTDEGNETDKQLIVSGLTVGKGGNPTGVNNRNTAFGVNSLQNANGVTGVSGGNENVAVGHQSLESVVEGTNNVGVGYIALRALTTGSSNTAIGSSALRSLTTGLGNVALGSALRNITTSSSNTVIGQNAGNNYNPLGGNPTTTSLSNSVLIGSSAIVTANGQTNVIVIGHNAEGNGSNTATLGNTSILKTFLRGALSLIARTKASVSGLVAGLFIIDIDNANRPSVYNGSDWKDLAYTDDLTNAPTEPITSLIGVNSDGDVVKGNEIEEDLSIKVDFGKGFFLKRPNGDVIARLINLDGDVPLLELLDLLTDFKTRFSPSGMMAFNDSGDRVFIEYPQLNIEPDFVATFGESTAGNYNITRTPIGTTWSGTVIPMDKIFGAKNNTPSYNATYTLGTIVDGASAMAVIDTTGETDFPSIDPLDATLIPGSDFEPDAIFEMYVYAVGTDVRYYFLYIKPA
jgi:hypothetical protein